MYNCKYCNKEFKDKGNLRRHEKYSHEVSIEKVTCPFCNELFEKCGLVTHKKSCKLNPDRYIPKKELKSFNEEWFSLPANCKYCGKEWKNGNSCMNHERFCKENPQRETPTYTNNLKTYHVKLHTGEIVPWNKGLTKETDERITKGAIKLSNTKKELFSIGISAGGGRCKDPQKEILRKQRISATMKKNGIAGGLREGSGRGKKGWYKGFFCDSSYELIYIIYNLDNGIKFKRCDRVYTYEYNNETHKYYPDFELPDGSLIEIKGYHTELVDIKAAAVKDRPLKILYEKDLKYAFDWVKENYKYNKLSDLYE